MEIFLFWLFFAVITAIAANARGRGSFSWFLLGLLFGPLALIAVLVMQNLRTPAGAAPGPTPETHVKCPDCRELVLKDARVCKHCGCKLVPQAG